MAERDPAPPIDFNLSLNLDPACFEYISELRDRLIDLLQTCQTIEDVEERLRKLYPNSNLVDNAIEHAIGSRKGNQKTLKLQSRHHSSGTGASFTGTLHHITTFAFARVSNFVREGVVGSKSDNEVTKFKTSLIEYIMNDVLKLAENFVNQISPSYIIYRSDIRTAMHADKDLFDLFLSDDKSPLIIQNHPILSQVNSTDKFPTHHSHNLESMTYKQKVRNMVDSENTFMRGLKLIIKVFKVQLEKLPHIRTDVKILFCNIEELLDLSNSLWMVLDDALESVGLENDEVPYVGTEILDLAQTEEFHAYFNFAYQRLSRNEHWRDAYQRIISNENTMNTIRTSGQHFDLAVKHLLPNYLLNTIIQFFEYFKNINELYELSKRHDNRSDELALKETISILIKTKRAIEDLLKSDLELENIEPLDPKFASPELVRETRERELESVLSHERNMPLTCMPPIEIYRFSEPDTDSNIQFEKEGHIQRATLTKLVERLTYHKCQPDFVDSFLITYRSFVSDPEELLNLLIERFKIPDPPLSLFCPGFTGSPDELPAYKHYLKKFRRQYSKPVKMRVINVLKLWIKNHYYDFERHPQLLVKLHSFLDEVYNDDKIWRSLIVSIRKSIEHKKTSQNDEFEIMLSKEPPPILWLNNKAEKPEKFDILTLHPREFGRQLTLFEFDLFRAIKRSELMNIDDDFGSKRKDEKQKLSPNLSRMTRHFTMFSYYIRKRIVEAEDFDKRCAVCNRVLEIMVELKALNNFTGLLSIGSAMLSAPINRLNHTMKSLGSNANILDEYRDLTKDHQTKLQQSLKNCDPPCIPYLGSYQTKLLHAKEGNKTFIDEIDTTSPTLSNDEWNSSFSNSPATPVSPRTPLPRTANLPPNSATSTLQNQFFGGCTLPRQINYNNNVNNNNNSISSIINNNNVAGKTNGLSHGSSTTTLTQHSVSTIMQPSVKLINFKKQRISAGLVTEIANYQNLPYCLRVQPEIRMYIESIESEMIQFVKTETAQQCRSVETDCAQKNSVPAMTEFLDNYLYKQSEKIEPRDCPKPLKSKSKLPDGWKSPGIKASSSGLPRQ